VIVVATDDFEVYHEAVTALRARGATFTTVELDEELPDRTAVVLTSDGETDRFRHSNCPVLVVDPDNSRAAVDDALATIGGGRGRTIIGIDPGQRPGIAVLEGETVVAAFQIPLGDAIDRISTELERRGAANPVVRVGDGARLQGGRLINELEDVRVELVDESGTTPYLGPGARGMGDVIAAINIARLEGEPIDSRQIEPTDGELQRIKDRSREHSERNRAIDETLARRVARGELTIESALAIHRGDEE